MKGLTKKALLMLLCLTMLAGMMTAVQAESTNVLNDTFDGMGNWYLRNYVNGTDTISVASPGADGTGKAGKLYASNGRAWMVGRNSGLITFETGYTYTFTWKMKTEASQDVGFWIWQATESGMTTTPAYAEQIYSATTEWQNYSYTFSVESFSDGSASKQLSPVFWLRAVAGTLYIDDFCVDKIKTEDVVSYDYLDVAASNGTALAVKDTTTLTLHGFSEGSDSTAITEGVMFTSSDSDVASVDANGTVTAKDEGIASITVTAAGLTESKKVMIAVGSDVKTVGFESGEWEDMADVAVLDTGVKKSGSSSLKLNAAGSNSQFAVASGIPTDGTTRASVLWFYDDGAEGSKGRIFPFGNGSVRTNFQIAVNETDGTYSVLGENVQNRGYKGYSINRSKGWHQLMLLQTGGVSTKLYLDGAVLMETVASSTPATALMTEIYYNPSGTAGSLWVDDFATLDVTPVEPEVDMTAAPIDKVITKDGAVIEGTPATFDNNINGWINWNISGAESTISYSESGADNTGGSVMFESVKGRPRLCRDAAFTWNKGSSYTVSWKMKTDNADGIPMFLWIDTPILITGGGVTENYFDADPGSKVWSATTDWQEFTWEFKIDDFSDGTKSLSSTAARLAFRTNDVAGKVYVDDFVVNETIPGYNKLGLQLENTMLFPEDTAQLTVVGHNGHALYKVAKEGLTFTSDNEEAVTVSEDGTVTAVANGTANITVSDGTLSAQIAVTVNDADTAVSEIHVSLDGSDETGDGTKNAPYATIQKAQEAIRGFRRMPQGGVTVLIHGGEYMLNETVTFTAEDSGTKEAPITYKAYNDETVTFTGAKKLDASKIQKVTDEKLLSRLVEEYAKDNLYQLDLGEQNVEMSPLEKSGNGYVTTPTRIFMNGTSLYEARWPNDDRSGEQYFTRAEPAELTDEEAEIYNGGGQPVKMKYVDKENRTAKWHIKEGDAYVGGAVAYLWARNELRIDTLDTENKIVTTLDPATYGQATYTVKTERYLYFENIFEEIDMPGESYVDREENILYFYPVGSVENAEMEISLLNEDMISIEGASYLTFEGIDFRNGRQRAVVTDENTDSITISDAEISGMSGDGIVVNGWNTTVENCHIYDIGAVPVRLNGGNREQLISSGNVLTGNKIHNGNRFNPKDLTAVHVTGVGHVISHNEIFDMEVGAIQYWETNNTVTEYNRIYDVQLLNADGGALYWGRNISELGNIVRYNYFHDIGGHIGQHGQQSIFTDDGNIGPAIYGNIFYKGGLPSFPLKTNGGQFHRIYNNIVIDNELGTFMQNWGVGRTGVSDKTKMTHWWMNMTDLNTFYGYGMTGYWRGRSQLLLSDTWKKYYTETEPTKQWVGVYDYFSYEKYNAAKALVDANDKEGLTKWLEENIPSGYTNMINDNVWINIPKIVTKGGEMTNLDNNLQLSTKEGKALFDESYGKEFTLTDEGLATIQKTISSFPQLDSTVMGPKSEVGGVAPVATDAYVTGVPEKNGTLIANYSYSDMDNDPEGVSKIYWYASDTADGEYTRIENGYGKYYTVSYEYEDKYLRFEVVPYDTKYTYGDAVVSDPIYIAANLSNVDKTELWKLITKVSDALNNAVVGTEIGQYPQESVDELTSVLNEARAVANDTNAYSFLVEQATDTLANAYEVFTKSVNNPMNSVDGARISINPMIKGENQKNWTNALAGGQIEFTEDGSMVLGSGGEKTVALYEAELAKNVEISFKMKAEPINANKDYSDGWIGIYFRQNVTNTWGWGGTCAMFDFKQNQIIFQQYKDAAGEAPEKLKHFDKKFEVGKEHEITVGVYDIEDSGKVMIGLSLDGEVIYSDILESDALFGTEGYFAISSSSNSGNFKLTVSPIYADTAKLEEAIENAESFLETAIVGDGYGEYSEEAVNALKDAVSDAKEIAENEDVVQREVDDAALAVRQALVDARNATSASGEVTEAGTITLNYSYPTADLNIKSGVNDVTIDVDPTRELPAINATSDDVKMSIQAGTVIAGDFKVPVLGSAPSGTFTNGTVSKVYGQGAEAIDTNIPVRIVLKGEAGKNVAYKNEAGKYTSVLKNITEDSITVATTVLNGQKYKAVKTTVGNDIVVYSYLLTEFVTYEGTGTSTPTTTPTVQPTIIPGGGTGIGGGFAGSGSTKEEKEPATSNFTDIIGHWAEKDINEMADKGIVSGVTKTTFEPDRSITRAEFAALMTRALKLTAANDDSVFTDVAGSAWYADEVAAAAAAGLIVGYDGNFRPDDTITREEMAVIIMKAHTFLGKSPLTGQIDKFADKDTVSEWAKAYVDQAVSVGLISGMTSDTFAPQENATRAQVTSLIKRLLAQ